MNRVVLRTLVIGGGAVVALGSLFTFRAADWPIYLTFVLLSMILYRHTVEVLPDMVLPMPGLALTIGFLYIAGPPIIVLNYVGPALVLLARAMVPARWRARVPEVRGASDFVARLLAGRVELWTDWGAGALGLATRWGIAATLAPGVRPATEPLALILGEVGGYTTWTVLSMLPIFSFPSVLQRTWEGPLREVGRDLGLVMILALTPFVFLIAYGYDRHGLPGATAWSLSALGLHFLLKRLNERRMTVAEQNRRLESLNRELEHRERLSAIGKMSSVVSHQMLQQLGMIGIHADLIRNAEDGGDPAAAATQAKANAAAIEEALGGVNRVLTDLLVFSRDLRVNLYEHRLADVLAECVAECRPQAADRDVVLRLDCPADATLSLDKLKIKQAVVNVLRNAIDASPAGEAVAVGARLEDGWAEIAIADHGPGVPARDREAVFMPFFTTKASGTGLGLAIARAFTEAHGGQIVLDGRSGRGATFVLRLPRRPDGGNGR